MLLCVLVWTRVQRNETLPQLPSARGIMSPSHASVCLASFTTPFLSNYHLSPDFFPLANERFPRDDEPTNEPDGAIAKITNLILSGGSGRWSVQKNIGQMS